MRRQNRNPIARRRVLRREIALRGSVTVAELCELLQASPATIRRDLDALEREGFVQRGYGGASVRAPRPAEETLVVREQKHIEAKRAIARATVDLISSGDTLFLNDGSTVLALARELAHSDLELFVATPAVSIAQILADNRNITVCLLGGLVRVGAQATGGHFAEAMVDQLNADLALLSCDAFNSQDGLCFMQSEDAALARKMTLKASRRVVLVHAAKFAWRARISGVPLNDIDVLVTEEIPPELQSELTRTRIEVVTAPPLSTGEGPTRAPGAAGGSRDSAQSAAAVPQGQDG